MSKENVMNTYNRYDLTIDSGYRSKVKDINGKEYIDFISGIAVNALGHSNPKIIESIKLQSQKVIHVSNNFWTKPLIDLASKLSENSDLDQTFFCNSGAEANEVAIKIARKYGKIYGDKNKTQIIYANNSFHGRTMGALSITGQEKYQKDFAPLIPDTVAIDFNNIQDLKNAFNKNTCAIFLEVIQGEGGILEIDKDFLMEARNLCDQYDALLVFDEVQTGIGRLGTLFAYQSFGIVPDIVTMAKGLGGGFPIGACLAIKKAAEVLVPGDQGNTFGGNPLACSVALTILNEILNENLLDNVNIMGAYLVNKLEELKDKYPIIKDIRGRGLLIGMEMSPKIKDFQISCFKNGLLLAPAGSNTIRFLPPLNVNKDEIDEMLVILEKTLSSFDF